MTEFIGFPRADGTVGIRNRVVAIGLGVSGANVAFRISGLLKDITPVFQNPQHTNIFAEIINHPNVAGIVMVDGEEDAQVSEDLVQQLGRTGKPHQIIKIGGLDSLEAINKATEASIDILRDVSTQRRVLVPFTRLLIGLIYVSRNLMNEVLRGFLSLAVRENGRLLWFEEREEKKTTLNKVIDRSISGELKPRQHPKSDPGIYRYRNIIEVEAIHRKMLECGVQIVASSIRKGEGSQHPLIPAVNFLADKSVNSPEPYALNLGRVRDGGLTLENAGLLLQNEILATASGKLGKEEMLRDVISI